MGWRGTLRTVGAAVRAAERESERRRRAAAREAARRQRESSREAVRRTKETQREQKEETRRRALEEAADEVREYDSYVARLVSVHHDTLETVDWQSILDAPPPDEPVRQADVVRRAKRRLANFSPTFLDRTLRRVATKQSQLEQELAAEEAKAEASHQRMMAEYRERLSELNESREFAARVLSGDMGAYSEAVDALNPFSDLDEIGTEVNVTLHTKNIVQADVAVHGGDVIPKEAKKLLKSGKLTLKKMPAGEYFELYQDHVCSCAVRVARDLLSILPVEIVIVNALDTILDTQTGHLEKQPILSVAIARATLDKLNLSAIDPSDSMRNFLHHMAFKRTTGFSATTSLSPDDIDPRG